jgi:seryl-tRNA synthetase
VEKILIDILAEEKELLASIDETDRRINRAVTKLEYVIDTCMETDYDLLTYIDNIREELKSLRLKQAEQNNDLHRAHKRIAECARYLVENKESAKEIQWLEPAKRRDHTPEELAEFVEKRKYKKTRALNGTIIRKGRAKYGKINKVQD